MHYQKRLFTFDLLKFIMSAIIFFYHFQQSTGIHFNLINFYNISINFSYIVGCFFMISGILTIRNIEDISFRNLLKKMIRIFPMSIVSIMFTLLIDLFFYLVFNCEFATLSFKTLLLNILLIFSGGFFKDVLAINPPLWYLCVLIMCYFAFFVIKYLSSKIKINEYYLYVLLIFLSLIVENTQISIPFLNSISTRGYIPFFIGCIISKTIFNYNNFDYISIFIVLFMIALGIWNYPVFFCYEKEVLEFVFFPNLLNTLKYIDAFFDFSWAKFLGNISFEIYLFHVPFIKIFNHISSIVGYNLFTSFALLLLLFIIIVLFSSATYQFIEKPIQRFIGKYLK